MILRKAITVVALMAASLLGAASANAKVFYLSGTSTRTSGGSSCSNALSTAWFSDYRSWGTASNQISAGTTIYLCGVFNGRANEELLIFHAGGTASEPIVVKFLPGAVLSAPYWSGNGAIHMDNVSHVIIDGQNTGIIQNTENGTGRAYHANSIAIHAANCTGCTVQNLTIQNLYVRTSTSDMGPSVAINCVNWHLANYFTVNHVTCHDAAWAIAGDGNNFTLEYSNIYHVDHGVASGSVGTNSGYNIHHNHFHDFANWDSPTNGYHHDGVHLWGRYGGRITGGAIHDNTFDGDFGVNVTAHVFLQDSISHVSVYNNVFTAPSTLTINSLWFAASSTNLQSGNPTGNSAYNNSINAGGHRSGTAMFIQSQLSFTALNNILAGGSSNITIQNGGTRSAAGINNNIYRNLFADFGDRNTFGYQGGIYISLSQWQAACHCDSASKMITGSQTTAFSSTTETVGASVDGVEVGAAGGATTSDAANLSVIATETNHDPELELLVTVGEGNGVNLSDLAVDELAGLAIGKDGAPRPTAGPWNVGPF